MKTKLLAILLLSILILPGCGQNSPAPQTSDVSAAVSASAPAAPSSAPSATGAESAALQDATNTTLPELSAVEVPPDEAASSAPATPDTTPEINPPASSQPAQPEVPASMQLRISSGDQSIVFQLNDSSAARSLYAQLPLSIGVENYAFNEKIFYPPEKLDASDTPLLSSGGAGTLGYYAPWGDVVLYYGSCDPASGLYTLGTVVSGADQIESLSGTIQVDAYELTETQIAD